jgi:hypothetical protein
MAAGGTPFLPICPSMTGLGIHNAGDEVVGLEPDKGEDEQNQYNDGEGSYFIAFSGYLLVGYCIHFHTLYRGKTVPRTGGGQERPHLPRFRQGI